MIRFIRVVCTRRGAHTAYVFRTMAVNDETGDATVVGRGAIPMDAAPLRDGQEQAPVVWRWQCPRCPNDKQVSLERHPDFWLRLAATGCTELDISLLP